MLFRSTARRQRGPLTAQSDHPRPSPDGGGSTAHRCMKNCRPGARSLRHGEAVTGVTWLSEGHPENEAWVAEHGKDREILTYTVRLPDRADYAFRACVRMPSLEMLIKIYEQSAHYQIGSWLRFDLCAITAPYIEDALVPERLFRGICLACRRWARESPSSCAGPEEGNDVVQLSMAVLMIALYASRLR